MGDPLRNPLRQHRGEHGRASKAALIFELLNQ